ncbi:Cu(I)-responsive transcriptional regulator [Simiduia litorea]|uniref:MerR family transcriptional regulator n=1 Tax=Simiduia litorea TaxID=1435348 RepID=UPI0036F3C638
MYINEVAKITGLTAKAIRYYEAEGIVAASGRSDSGYRLYSRENLDHLCFLQHARSVGFSVQESATLLNLYRSNPDASDTVKALVGEKLAQLRSKKREIERLEATLENLWACCDGRGEHHCEILDRLASEEFHGGLQ